MRLLGVVDDNERIRMAIRRRRNGEETFECGPSNRVELHFCWYDFWVGAFWDSQKRVLYVCPLPMLAIRITFRSKKP